MESAGPGRLIAGRYRLAAVIGRGGMGVVWRARDELLGRDVAVKGLAWPTHFSEAERRAACRRATGEAQVAARISHRNVVRIFDVIEEGGCPWIVMELLPPRSLHDVIEQEGPLSPAQAAAVGLGILAALRAVHAEGIVHRDVKPANILVTEDRVVLTDFGIAQATGTSALTTAIGVLIGSPAYIAPERARGGQSGPPADLWGLGASLYAAVEGHGPFDRDGGGLASLTAVVADEPERAAHAGPLLWPAISGLLRKDPGKRLDAAAAERMLRCAAARAGTVTPRLRRPLVAAFVQFLASLTGRARVGAERPAVPFRVLDREVTRAVIGVVELLDYLRPVGHGAGAQCVRVTRDDVRAEVAWPGYPLRVTGPGRAEHDAAAGWPGQLGVMDGVALGVDDGRLEAECLGQELDQPVGIVGAQ
jgi:hypothetical protein